MGADSPGSEILVVVADETLRDEILLVLHRREFAARACAPENARRLLSESGADLVICDGAAGVFAALTRLEPRLRPALLLVSRTEGEGRGDDDDHDDQRDLQADGVLGLPLDARSLAVLARSLCRLGQLEREKRRNVRRITRAMTHDLRNPLGAVIAYMDIALGEQDPSEMRETIELALDSARELERVLGATASLANLEQGNPVVERRRMPIRGIIENALERGKKRLARRGVEVHLDIDPDLEILADPGLLPRMWDILIDRAARDTTPEIGLRIDAHRENRVLVTSIAAAGPVIPAGRITSLFSPRAGEDGRVTGVLLSYVRRVVEMHGGTITVESPAPGIGSGARYVARIPDEKGTP